VTVPRARKRFGQHFLIDRNIVRKILASAEITSQSHVLEIGPGRGALTRDLCRQAGHVVALEVDRDLHGYLAESLSDCPNLDLRLVDALTFDYEQLPAGTIAVANLPYNISTPLLFRLLDARRRFSRLVLMLQTEVARRLVAKPCTADYGVLSVMAQAMADVKLAFHVAPTCFQPPPEVGSTVVTLTMPAMDRMPADDTTFRRIVRAAFAHRRKTLLNSLKDEGFQPEVITAAFESAGLSPARRAETLSIDDYTRLTVEFSKVRRG
jgi:16S rRNA (adenine1518-N6/adenine1519-N6)-dimethyltransferase